MRNQPHQPDARLERVREGYEAFNRQDIEPILELVDEQIEYRMPMDPMGVYPVFRGHAGIREFYEAVWAQSERFEAVVQSISRMGDDMVVVLGHFLVRPHGESDEIEFGFTHFWTERNGKAVEVAFHDADNPFSVLESRRESAA